MEDNETLVDRIGRGTKWALMFIPELTFYVPFDFFTTPIRDRLIPRSWKKENPDLACRGYQANSDPIMCKPAERYEHKWLLKCLCWNYDMKTGECMKYRKKR